MRRVHGSVSDNLAGFAVSLTNRLRAQRRAREGLIAIILALVAYLGTLDPADLA